MLTALLLTLTAHMLVLLPTLVLAETTLLDALAPARRLMVLFHWLDSLLVRKKQQLVSKIQKDIRP